MISLLKNGVLGNLSSIVIESFSSGDLGCGLRPNHETITYEDSADYEGESFDILAHLKAEQEAETKRIQKE